MATVQDILNKKGPWVQTAQPTDTVLDAVRMLAEKNIGGLVVVEGPRIAGIFTERDIMNRVVLKGLDPTVTRIADVMTTRLFYTTPEETVSTCMSKIVNERCRHLPVIEGGRLVGIISAGDLMRHHIGELALELGYLRQYLYETPANQTET